MFQNQNHIWLKGPFKVQNGQIGFNTKKYVKCIDRFSDSILQLTFKKIPLVEF